MAVVVPARDTTLMRHPMGNLRMWACCLLLPPMNNLNDVEHIQTLVLPHLKFINVGTIYNLINVVHKGILPHKMKEKSRCREMLKNSSMISMTMRLNLTNFAPLHKFPPTMFAIVGQSLLPLLKPLNGIIIFLRDRPRSRCAPKTERLLCTYDS